MGAELGHLCLFFSCAFLVSVDQSGRALFLPALGGADTQGNRVFYALEGEEGYYLEKSLTKISFGKYAVN